MFASRGTIKKFGLFSGVGRFCLLPLALSALVACQHASRLAPIEQLDQPPDIRLNHHVVSRGDTLYSIAWRYGMDYHRLASINNINSPYVIYVGQKISLGHEGRGQNDDIPASPGTMVVAVPDTSSGVTEVGGVTEVASPGPVTAEVSTTSPAVKHSEEHAVERSAAAVAASAGSWQWPASGRMLAGFSAADPLRKGIDLEGKLGEPVIAARAGSVVYAGSGLAGYGELVIIKHDEQFLSAYGHNSKLLVKEGDAVRAGQKIAEVGSSGTDSNKLHFEIRREGKPVDPLQYLPKK